MLETNSVSLQMEIFRVIATFTGFPDPLYPKERPAFLWIVDLSAALQAETDGEMRSAYAVSSIRRRSAALAILKDWKFRSSIREFRIVDR